MSIFSDSNLKIIDLPKRYFKANELYVDACLLLDTETKELILAKNTSNAYEEIFRIGGGLGEMPIKYDNTSTTEKVIMGYALEGVEEFLDETTQTSFSGIIFLLQHPELRKIQCTELVSLNSTTGVNTDQTGINIYGQPYIEEIILPKLKYSNGTIRIDGSGNQNNTGNLIVDFSSLEVVGQHLFLTGLNYLFGPLNLSNLVKVNLNLSLYNLNNVTSIDLSKLIRANNYQIFQNNNMTSLNMASFSKTNGDIGVFDNPNLTSIIVNPNGFYSPVNQYNFYNNFLDVTTVDSILNAQRTYAETNNITGGTLLLNGGMNAQPTGQYSNPDYVYLTGTLGWNVQIN